MFTVSNLHHLVPTGYKCHEHQTLFYMKRVIILAFIVAKLSQVKDFQTKSSKESVDILDFVSLHTTA